MRAENFSCMLDGAKVLLGARDNFTDVGNHAGAVGTISTVKFFYKIQVIKLVPIKYNVISPTYFFDVVNRKASQLVKGNEYICNHQRNNHQVNDWAGNQILRAVSHQPAKKIHFQPAVCFFDGLFKLNAFSLNLKKHAGWLFAECRTQFVLKHGNLVKQLLDTVVHQCPNIFLNDTRLTQCQTKYRSKRYKKVARLASLSADDDICFMLPAANSANIDMHEVRFWIIADATPTQGDGSAPQLIQRNAFDIKIDRFGLHVQAALGNPI